MRTITITLRNKGQAAVDCSVILSSNADLFTADNPQPAIIPPGGTGTLDVHFTAAAEPGEHVGFLTIAAGNLIIPLTAETIAGPEIIIEENLEQTLEYRLVKDADAEWFECGFLSPFETLPGSAADGWTDPGGYLLFRLHRSDDLVNWDHDFLPCPTSPEPRGDDWMIWGRCATPKVWKNVTVDIDLTSARAGKSITMLNIFGANVPLPGYPYAMPGDAARLQSDLLAAGYSGSTVSSSHAALSVVVTNNVQSGQDAFAVTLSGATVTMVKNASGANISLPGYPYAVPSAIASLRADLLAAGFPYIDVRAFADFWSIFIPNRETQFSTRNSTLTITPADPYTYQGLTGTGTDAGNLIYGQASNIRATSGLAALDEKARQFVRLGISRGPNYLFD